MQNNFLFFVLFTVFVISMLILDLGVFSKKSKEIKFKEAIVRCCIWVTIALLFNIGIYFWQGYEKALEFFTGYIIEYSLSIDNIFVFILVFSYFKVPTAYQHKVLFWGIIGALIMRAVFIAAGITLITKFHWIIYIFGAFLIFTGIKMLLEKDKEVHPDKNPMLKLFRKIMPVTRGYEKDNFFVNKNSRWFATPLFITLLIIETTDIIFAVDSVPAVLAVTYDPLIVYTSNVLAILGLRALFFALAGIVKLFHHLHYGLSAILVFVGAKMLLADIYKIPISIALGVVVGILAVSIITSITFPAKKSGKNKS